MIIAPAKIAIHCKDTMIHDREATPNIPKLVSPAPTNALLNTQLRMVGLDESDTGIGNWNRIYYSVVWHPAPIFLNVGKPP